MLLSEFRESPLFRPALIVPMAIMLIFSFFNMTAPPDPVRTAASFKLGIVNQDEGLTFPPIKVASRVLSALGENFPFSVKEFSDPQEARSALEAGAASAVILFQPEFSKLALSEENFEIEIWNAHHLTVAETQISTQLPMMIQMAMSGGVANLRLALAKGRLPSTVPPVTAKVETLHGVSNSTKLVAPFVMTFTTWLAGLVGALILFLATKGVTAPLGRAMLRSSILVVSLGIGSLALSIVVASTTGDLGLLFPVWWQVWVTALCLGWLMLGIFAVLAPLALIFLLPMVFYQSALGGAMAPYTAAPSWLVTIGEVIPFHLIGAGYRTIVLGGGNALPFDWLAGSAAVGWC